MSESLARAAVITAYPPSTTVTYTTNPSVLIPVADKASTDIIYYVVSYWGNIISYCRIATSLP